MSVNDSARTENNLGSNGVLFSDEQSTPEQPSGSNLSLGDSQERIGKFLKNYVEIPRSLEDLVVEVEELCLSQQRDHLTPQTRDAKYQFLSILWKWVWNGNKAVVIEYLKSRCQYPFEPVESLLIIRASLLLQLGLADEATTIVENLQRSRILAANVLCGIAAFEWDEKSVAIEKLFKTLTSVKKLLKNLDASNQSNQGLLDIFGDPLTEVSAKRWYARLTSYITSCYAQTNNYAKALSICDNFLKGDADSEPSSNEISEHIRPSVSLTLARLQLQIGAVEETRLTIQNLKEFAWNHEPSQSVNIGACEMLEGLVDYAASDYSAAIMKFEKLLEYLSQNENCDDYEHIIQTKGYIEDGIFDSECPFRVSLCNNLAICYLNQSNLTGAVAILEECIAQDPIRNMQVSIVFNLSTLYDLAKSRTESTRCKRDLRDLSKFLHIENRFNDPKDFRLQT